MYIPFSRRTKSPTPWNTLLYNKLLQDMIGRGYGWTSETSSLLHMNVTNIVPVSTITVPPPLNLLITGTLSLKTELISRSSAGFLSKNNHLRNISILENIGEARMRWRSRKDNPTSNLARWCPQGPTKPVVAALSFSSRIMIKLTKASILSTKFSHTW